jgi:hypothetical protein
MIHFGIVLYDTALADIIRLFRSIEIACRQACYEFTVTFLRNSDEHLILPDEILNTTNIIEYTGNLGFGKGHNKIVESLNTGEGWYIGLNPDGFLSPWSLKELKQWKPTVDNFYEFQQHPQEHPKVFDRITGRTAWASGAAFLISLSLYRDLGGFDPMFFMYCEDVDLSWRVYERGGACYNMANALFFHDVCDNRESVTTVNQMLASQILLARKWGATRVAEEITARLRDNEQRNHLPKTQISELHGRKLRTKIPLFCNFSSPGLFSATRW